MDGVSSQPADQASGSLEESLKKLLDSPIIGDGVREVVGVITKVEKGIFQVQFD